jgi:hypothetical protein
MLWSAFAAAVLAVVIAGCYASDVIAERERALHHWLNKGRFDRAYERNRAARRPDLRLVRGGRHEKR